MLCVAKKHTLTHVVLSFFLFLLTSSFLLPQVPAHYRDMYNESSPTNTRKEGGKAGGKEGQFTAQEQLMFGYITEMDDVVGDIHQTLLRYVK